MTELPRYDLEKYQDHTETVHLTAKQIAKDFAMFGFDVSFSGNTALAYTELMHQVTRHIDEMMHSDPQRLFALMYQIDISQSAVKQCLDLAENPSAALADLIIRREMMKVLTFQFFKKQKQKPG
jgi:hypothetical protein